MGGSILSAAKPDSHVLDRTLEGREGSVVGRGVVASEGFLFGVLNAGNVRPGKVGKGRGFQRFGSQLCYRVGFLSLASHGFP